jgi:cytochrome c2
MRRAFGYEILMTILLLQAGCDREPAPDEAITRTSAGSADRGLRLVAHYQCANCHEIPEVPGHRNGMGPSLEAFGRSSYIAGHVPNVPSLLQQWLESPQSLVPGTAMPDLGVSEEDARDMTAYLLSLK